MRYGYAVLADQEDELSSPKLFFDRMISIDRFFVDRGNSRYKRGALLRNVDENDEVVVQSFTDCGLSENEIDELKKKLVLKKAELRFVSDSADENNKIASPSGKRRRKLRLQLDEELFQQLYMQLKKKEIRKSDMVKQLGISWPALQNRIERYEEEHNGTLDTGIDLEHL